MKKSSSNEVRREKELIKFAGVKVRKEIDEKSSKKRKELSKK